VGETLKSLVHLLELGRQPRATEKTAGGVVLGDEAVEEPVEVLQRLDQTEEATMPGVDGDVLETQSQARRGEKPVAVPALEGEIDTRDLIEVVEDHQCRRVVEQRDPAGLQPAALLPAREQAEQLRLADQLEFPAHTPVLASREFAPLQPGTRPRLLSHNRRLRSPNLEMGVRKST
jgi:hypothetical protein